MLILWLLRIKWQSQRFMSYSFFFGVTHFEQYFINEFSSLIPSDAIIRSQLCPSRTDMLISRRHDGYAILLRKSILILLSSNTCKWEVCGGTLCQWLRARAIMGLTLRKINFRSENSNCLIFYRGHFSFVDSDYQFPIEFNYAGIMSKKKYFKTLWWCIPTSPNTHCSTVSEILVSLGLDKWHPGDVLPLEIIRNTVQGISVA